ncbi:Pimeloyl-ACP methyl ester carboxylesterase [Ralstonia sp. 25mfcol4.1]|uniref:alpha/beta fold hydrolase n=1 Tax=Ralstonia sp. 25mfcol4.1 TaxID=1761899 RepID=UPI00048B589C|nr:alpha/beta hydrolase [Ralstonia sp. 25mfcol4.1]SDP77532.1 Pimeloyl-ACP methyl ester carboxylesterase [Ralstonia sp. 25mfcol4.1]
MQNAAQPRQQEAWFETSTGAKLLVRNFSPLEPAETVPLLCLHGFMRNSRDFCELGELLASQGVQVIAPDLRGRGFSTRFTDAKDYHYDLVKGDVWDLLDHLQIERVAVLGIALGGLIAMDMAAERPGRVSGIVLNDLGAEIVESSSKRMANNVAAADFSFDEAVERMKLHFGETYPDLTDERWKDLMLRAYREFSPGRYARDFDMLSLVDAKRMKEERPDAWSQFLATQEIPVAILRGETSDFFTEDCARRMVAAHRNATLTTVPGRGHPPLLDEPESLSAVTALLRAASL